jgi:hypothetical protein
MNTFGKTSLQNREEDASVQMLLTASGSSQRGFLLS